MPAPDFTDAVWRKSSNGDQACVEVAVLADVAGVRDSKKPSAGTIVLGAGAWTTFRATVKRGDLDLT